MTESSMAQMIELKRWADRDLYAVVDKHLDRLTTDDASIMLRILDHMHAVDSIFQHHLQGLPHTYRSPQSDTTPEFEVLASSVKKVDDWYVSYVAGMEEKDFEQTLAFEFTSGKAARMRRSEIILHICLHGTYHRGNAGALLQLRGIAPGRDSITDFLEEAVGS